MKSYFLAMACTGAGLSALALVYLALLPLLGKRYRPARLYRVWVVVLAGLLIPFSLLASRPLMTVELPRALSRPVGGGAATAASLTAESQTADTVQAPSAVQASAAGRPHSSLSGPMPTLSMHMWRIRPERPRQIGR